MYVVVQEDRDPPPVRCFATFTPVCALADWLAAWPQLKSENGIVRHNTRWYNGAGVQD